MKPRVIFGAVIQTIICLASLPQIRKSCKYPGKGTRCFPKNRMIPIYRRAFSIEKKGFWSFSINFLEDDGVILTFEDNSSIISVIGARLSSSTPARLLLVWDAPMDENAALCSSKSSEKEHFRFFDWCVTRRKELFFFAHETVFYGFEDIFDICPAKRGKMVQNSM